MGTDSTDELHQIHQQSQLYKDRKMYEMDLWIQMKTKSKVLQFYRKQMNLTVCFFFLVVDSIGVHVTKIPSLTFL